MHAPRTRTASTAREPRSGGSRASSHLRTAARCAHRPRAESYASCRTTRPDCARHSRSLLRARFGAPAVPCRCGAARSLLLLLLGSTMRTCARPDRSAGCNARRRSGASCCSGATPRGTRRSKCRRLRARRARSTRRHSRSTI
jgi:hypothetical protein